MYPTKINIELTKIALVIRSWYRKLIDDLKKYICHCGRLHVGNENWYRFIKAQKVW